MGETRDAYVNKLKAKLDEWNADIDRLEARARYRQADMEQACQRQIDDLKVRRRKARETLEALRNASGEAWDELRIGLDTAADALGRAIRSARAKFDRDEPVS